jgi:hypothetical protein|tara:strand:+ start:125 stop:388 length:264 start_codon:yes stop_codon:yes gene_type:complete
MPKVGKEEFEYTPEGIAEAEDYSKATGIPVTNASMRSESYQMGGLVGGRPRMGGGLSRQRSPIAPTDFPPINVPFGPSYKKGGKVKK